MSVLRTATSRVTSIVWLGAPTLCVGPIDVAVDTTRHLLYAETVDADSQRVRITAVDETGGLGNGTAFWTTLLSLSAGMAGGGLVDPVQRRIYLLQSDSYQVTVLTCQAAPLVTVLGVGTWPVDIAYDPGTRLLYVADSYSDQLTVINARTNRVVRSRNVGRTPMGVAVDPTTHAVYVANYNDETVGVLDGSPGGRRRTLAVLPTGINPVAVDVDPVLHTVVVTNDFANTVTVLDTSAGPANTRVDSTVAVGQDPLAVTTTTHQVFVVNHQSDSVAGLTAR